MKLIKKSLVRNKMINDRHDRKVRHKFSSLKIKSADLLPVIYRYKLPTISVGEKKNKRADKAAGNRYQKFFFVSSVM